jgi:hypothetical protein
VSDNYPLTCRACGFSGDLLDDFDTMGACDDQVFCPGCHAEIDATTGEKHMGCKQCLAEIQPTLFT